MAENARLDGHGAASWAEVVRAYCELMDDVMPHLPDSEQIVYHRLFRLSHAQQSPFVKCRYEDLAPQCGVSLSTVRRAVKGLRAKKLVKTLWQSHSGTTFQVYRCLPSSIGQRFSPDLGEGVISPLPSGSQVGHRSTMRSVRRIGHCLSTASNVWGRHV